MKSFRAVIIKHKVPQENIGKERLSTVQIRLCHTKLIWGMTADTNLSICWLEGTREQQTPAFILGEAGRRSHLD